MAHQSGGHGRHHGGHGHHGMQYLGLFSLLRAFPILLPILFLMMLW